VVFHTHTGLKKKLREGLYDSQTVVPNPKKSRRISLKEKQRLRRENQTAEEHQIDKTHNNEEHIYSRQHEKKLETVTGKI
jgi:hypothetical protein